MCRYQLDKSTVPRCISSVVKHIDRIVVAIRKAVVPYNTLPGGEIDIRRYEPAGGGIIVAALEVVQPRLTVVDVASVTEGLIESEISRQAARSA